MREYIVKPSIVTQYPDPTEEELKSPLFNAIWGVIKGWDISEDPQAMNPMRTSAMGNHAVAIMHAIHAMQIPPLLVIRENGEIHT